MEQKNRGRRTHTLQGQWWQQFWGYHGRRCFKSRSFGLERRVVWWQDINVSDVQPTSTWNGDNRLAGAQGCTAAADQKNLKQFNQIQYHIYLI